MYVVTVARKPLSESTVAANVLQYGCGALAIDASRVGSGLRIQSAAGGLGDGVIYSTADEYQLGTGRAYRVGGRWPTNLVLQHRAGCRNVGTKQVAKGGGNGNRSRDLEHERGFLTTRQAGGYGTSHYGPDGKETVAVWECEPGCPVSDLDMQSGVLQSGGKTGALYARLPEGSVYGGGMTGGTSPWHSDKGGASRFFKVLVG